MNTSKFIIACLSLVVVLFAGTVSNAQKSVKIDQSVDAATKQLLAQSPAAAALAKTAKGILMFPSVKKAGFIVGGQSGDGSLRVNGTTVGYYNTTAASFGLQAGAQKFSYAMFFMNDNALDYLKKSHGWEVGVGPSFVIVDEGVARSLSTSTARSDIYVFFFGQKGLMGGLGIQGSKITKFDPNN
jgi:lipid-binding SYLF domain-containing protein